MITIDNQTLETKIIEALGIICSKFAIEISIDSDCCPGLIGGLISSQVLISVMGKLESTLNIVIPDNCYIFHDKKTNKQLSIKEAVDKLKKLATYGE